MTTAEPLVPETPRATRRITRAFLVCHGLRWLPIGFVMLSLGFGTTAWHFLAGAVVGGLGRALLTGPLESWYVEAVRVLDPATALRPGLSAAGFAEGIALATGALLSALLPTLGAGLPLTDRSRS